MTSVASIVENIDQLRDGKVLPPSIAEEYLTSKGVLDAAYLSYKTKEKIRQASLNKAVRETCGFLNFLPNVEENEVTFAEFKEHYKFGKYVNTREWIEYFHVKTGKLLTREALQGYVLKIQ